MNVLLARILKYLNGTLILNDYYLFASFLLKNYKSFNEYSLAQVVELSKVSQQSILEFLALLGFSSFEQFQKKLYQDEMMRMDQIRARMLGLNLNEFLERIKLTDNNEAFLEEIKAIITDIHECKRVILIGALYPMSISVELQTDLITFGKEVIQYHSFDHNLVFESGDYVIFISATGRALKGFMQDKPQLSLEECHSLLITQNPTYVRKPVSKTTLQVPGKFESIIFNYQIMTIFDLIRIMYYQTYQQL